MTGTHDDRHGVHEDEMQSVALVGDSLVAEGDWGDWITGHNVINLGVSGDTTDDVLARLDDVVTSSPDEILLLIGTNDFAMRRHVEHVVRNIQTMLVDLRRELPGSRMLVHSILPRGREYTHSIQVANIHLRQFCSTVRAQYLDLWPALALDNQELDPQFSNDRLHLNAAGYQAWMGELAPALLRLREEPPMSTPIRIIARDEFSRPV